MTRLRVILDAVLEPGADGVARYAEELTRALLASAPRGTDLSGYVAASPEADYELLERRLPGLAALDKSALARRELRRAWQHGFTRLPGTGMLHAMSALAPLTRHDRTRDASTQVVVTIHDAIAFTHPDLMAGRDAGWATTMARRAEKYADAVVVPSHAVAAQLGEHLDLGERVRVIGAAPGTRVVAPRGADARAAELELPDQYILAVVADAPHAGAEMLLRALALPGADVLPLVLVTDPVDGAPAVDVHAIADEAGVAARVHRLDGLDEHDLALVLDRASLVVVPSLAAGFGPTLIEAFAHGVPVVHTDAPALTEIAADAGVEVPLEPADDLAARLAESIGRVLGDDGLADRLRTLGRDRVSVFTWRDAAEKVWQLHADL